MMIVLLEYIDLFSMCMCMNIILGNHYSVDNILNALPSAQLTEILGVSLQISHPFVTRKATSSTTFLFIK